VSRWRIVALAAGVAACTDLIGDFNRIVAIQVVGTLTPQVEEGDTLRLQARALQADGDVVPDASILWVIIDVDSGQIGFTLDSLTGLVTAVTKSSGRVQARVEELATPPITLTVSAAPDSLAATGDQRVTFDTTTAEVSPGLVTVVLDLTTSPGEELPLAEKPVDYALVEPAPGSELSQGIFLTMSDTVPGSDPHRVTIQTGSNGQASAVLRRLPDFALPDSAVVHATAMTATAAPVAGSPIRFVVLFP
jgi:hypothetical protein